MYHGLKDVLEGGRIEINITLLGEDMLIVISDNGAGIDEDQLIAVNMQLQSERVGGGLALSNIEKRIRMLFGNSYGICVYSTPNAGTDVEVHVPLNHGTPRRYEVRTGPNSDDR